MSRVFVCAGSVAVGGVAQEMMGQSKGFGVGVEVGMGEGGAQERDGVADLVLAAGAGVHVKEPAPGSVVERCDGEDLFEGTGGVIGMIGLAVGEVS